MGDMNIDLTKLSTNNDIELYFNTLTCHNFESHINSPTRVQYNTKSNTLYCATLIDHIFSNLQNTNALLVIFYTLIAITMQTF